MGGVPAAAGRDQVGDSGTLGSNGGTDGAWDYFYLDNVLYHGHRLTIFYDKAGTRYGKGKGFFLYVDGRQAATSATLSRMTFAG